MNIRKHIPNTITCASLAFGCYASVLALNGEYWGAMMMIFVAAIFDFLDGLAARLLNAFSPIGKDLDSLADMVAFGVAPGMLLFDFIDRMQKTIAWENPVYGKCFLLAAFLIPVFSALRLAKFNNDKRQTSSFIGLPVPAHALFWVSLIYVLGLSALGNVGSTWPVHDIVIDLSSISPTCLLIAVSLLAVGSSLLLVSEIPMFSLKVKSLAWKGNELRYLLVLSSIGFVIGLGILGISITIVLYVLLSVFNRQK